MQKIGFILIFIAAIIAGCSVSKKSGGPVRDTEMGSAAENSLESVIRNNLSNNDFHIQKADINVIQDNISVRLSAGIKFKRPDTLLITVRSKTGIEAGRAFITRDTIMINDRINKKQLVGNPESIIAKYGIDPGMIFVILGDIIVEEKDRKGTMECVKGEMRKEFVTRDKNVEYIIDCQRKKLKRAFFEGDIRTGNVVVGLSDFISSGGLNYPGRIEISDDNNSVRIIMEIKRIESPWVGKIGVISGQGYKVIKIR